MATFVEITPDPFASTFASAMATQADSLMAAQSRGASGLYGEFAHVRRPVRGIQLKRDTYATIEVKTAKGESIPLVDSGRADASSVPSWAQQSYSNYPNSNFLVQSIQENREEKQQIVLTFGEPYVFFYGEQPRMIQVSGVLMNSEDFNWRAEWWYNYDNYLRGTKCVEQKTRVYLSWDDIIVEGYLMNCAASESSENRNIVMFNFTMFLTNYSNFSDILGHEFPTVSMAEVNVDPNNVDSIGGTATLVSDTLKVRSLNQTSDLPSSESLLDFLKTGMTALVTIYDEVEDAFNMAAQFFGGRLVRVPIGYQGSQVYDDLQFAQASVNVISAGPGAISSGYIANCTNLFMINGTVSDRWSPTPDNLRGRISLNTDEYIASQQPIGPSVPRPTDLFAAQKAEDNQLSLQMQEAFLEFGISTDPPSDLLILAGRAAFALLTLVAPAGGFGSNTVDLATTAPF